MSLVRRAAVLAFLFLTATALVDTADVIDSEIGSCEFLFAV